MYGWYHLQQCVQVGLHPVEQVCSRHTFFFFFFFLNQSILSIVSAMSTTGKRSNTISTS